MRLYEIEQTAIEIPKYFYRGSPVATRSAHLTKIYSRPKDDLPDNLNALLQEEKISRVYGLSYNTPFKISRTYSGMSNWGFGVYFASTIDWAKRYGTSIAMVEIEPQSILAIRAQDFAHEVEGTSSGLLRKKLTAATGGAGMREEAAVMSRVVKTIKRGAKALYVETDPGQGQICVFGRSAIFPRFYFELQTETKSED